MGGRNEKLKEKVHLAVNGGGVEVAKCLRKIKTLGGWGVGVCQERDS